MTNTILGTLTEMFGYTFLVRAFIVGALVSICAALLGVSLVLKRYSMIGDGLSHVGFGSLAAAAAFNVAPLFVSIPVVIAAAFLLLRLGERHLIKGDAAIALISTSSLALGVVIISQTTGMNTDVCNYLFGSILAMNKNDVYLSIALSVTVIIIFVVFYNKLFAITFDETFAGASGVKTGVYNMLIALLTALTIVLGMRMMGAMLISALIIFPALTSMRLFKKFKSVSICSVCISLVCYFTGIVVSYIYAMPSGASVVLANISAFAVFSLCNIIKPRLPPSPAARNPALSVPPAAGHSFCVPLICLLLTLSCNGGKPDADGTDSSNSGNAGGINRTGAAEADKVIEIKEKMFIAQTNDVYLNPDEYLGRTIKLEGLFKREQSVYGDYCFVLRYGPGCCGNDGNAGFEVAWETPDGPHSGGAAPSAQDAHPPARYPAVDDWVEAAGVLKKYEEDGIQYLYLALSSLKVQDKRGAEFVTQ